MTLLLIVLPIFGVFLLPVWCACAVSGHCESERLIPPRRHPYYLPPSDN